MNINLAIGGKCAGQEVGYLRDIHPCVELTVKEIDGDTPATGFEVATYQWRCFAMKGGPMFEALVPLGIENDEAARLVHEYLEESKIRSVAKR